jgi:hypothetical protein
MVPYDDVAVFRDADADAGGDEHELPLAIRFPADRVLVAVRREQAQQIEVRRRKRAQEEQ